MYIIRSANRIFNPDAPTHNCYGFLVKVIDGLPKYMWAYRISQLPIKPMIFPTKKAILETFKVQGIHRVDLWLSANSLKVVRLRSSVAIPGLGNLARDYRVAIRQIQGASSMLRKALTGNGYATVAQLIYEDVGKVLERIKLEYDDKANQIAGKQGRVRRIRKC